MSGGTLAAILLVALIAVVVWANLRARGRPLDEEERRDMWDGPP